MSVYAYAQNQLKELRMMEIKKSLAAIGEVIAHPTEYPEEYELCKKFFGADALEAAKKAPIQRQYEKTFEGIDGAVARMMGDNDEEGMNAAVARMMNR